MVIIMDLEQLKKLQQELLAIISNIVIESDDSSIETMQKEALEVINGFKRSY